MPRVEFVTATEVECSKCHKTQPLSEFPIQKNKQNGRSYYHTHCNECRRERARKVIRGLSKEEIRRRNLWAEFKITVEDWDSLFQSQGKKCAICGTKEKTGNGFCTDHCHKSGKIRGILCTCCNTVLGHARDNPEILIKAVWYLQDKG